MEIVDRILLPIDFVGKSDLRAGAVAAGGEIQLAQPLLPSILEAVISQRTCAQG